MEESPSDRPLSRRGGGPCGASSHTDLWLAEIQKRVTQGEGATQIARGANLPFYGIKDALNRVKSMPDGPAPGRKTRSGKQNKEVIKPALVRLEEELVANPIRSIRALFMQCGGDVCMWGFVSPVSPDLFADIHTREHPPVPEA